MHQHSQEYIAGIKLIEALGALRPLSGGSLNLSALDNLNLTTAAYLNNTAGRSQSTHIGQDLTEQVGNIAERFAEIRQTIKVKDGGKIWIGNESGNLLQLISELMNIVKTLASELASHMHIGVTTGPGTSGPPQKPDTYIKASSDTEAIKSALDRMA